MSSAYIILKGDINMNKERKIWFLISVISGMICYGMIVAAVYDIRPKYGIYIVVSSFIVWYIGIIMFAMTRFMTTKEIISILSRGIEMRKSDKEIDVILSTDEEREKYVNKCVDYLLGTLDSVQWVSLAHVRNELAPITLQDKIELLKSLIINPRKKEEN